MNRTTLSIPGLVSRREIMIAGAAWLTAAMAGCAGPACRSWGNHGGPRGVASYARPPLALGTKSDEIWQKQRDNADASNFVIYQHEFVLNSLRLNPLGEDHIKQIAVRLGEGVTYPVIVERNQTSPKPTSKHKYPVHTNPELDNSRREVVVKALVALGIQDAEDRVLVSTPYSWGINGNQAEGVYNNYNSRGAGGRGGFGGGFGGFGGMGGGGGGGGFGGGGFF